MVRDEHTGVLKCEGRIKGYRPTYLPGGPFAEKLIVHTHNQVMHLGTANTMASVRENWWIPKLRAKVKKVIKKCNVCKVFSTRPYGVPSTSALPEYRTEGSRPFEVTGVDFAGPFSYKVGKKEQGKCYLIIFTCASSRAVHLEVTRTQTADEFKQKLNAFISRRTRPRIIISDNAKVFKTTADWIKTIRKSEKLQDYLARETSSSLDFLMGPPYARLASLADLFSRFFPTAEPVHRLVQSMNTACPSYRFNNVCVGTVDNAKVFKTTADWIKTIRKSEKLQDYLARETSSSLDFLMGPPYARLASLADLFSRFFPTAEPVHRLVQSMNTACPSYRFNNVCVGTVDDPEINKGISG